MSIIESHFRRVVLSLVNLVFGNPIGFALLGWINRQWTVFETIFFAYPASQDFSNAYTYSWQREITRWHPWICGMFHQGDKWGLKMGISAKEADLLDPANLDNLRRLLEKAEGLQKRLGTRRKSFAGILPGVLWMRRLVRDCPEADLTVSALLAAVQKVLELLALPQDVPVIVLGGRGFIGRRFVAALKKGYAGEVFAVDIKGAENRKWPSQLTGQRAIVVNAANRDALKEYVSSFWPELVLLNEVYPGPSNREVKALQLRGCKAFHLAGIRAQCYPPFPGAYEGAVPCCAALPQEPLDVLLHRLI